MGPILANQSKGFCRFGIVVFCSLLIGCGGDEDSTKTSGSADAGSYARGEGADSVPEPGGERRLGGQADTKSEPTQDINETKKDVSDALSLEDSKIESRFPDGFNGEVFGPADTAEKGDGSNGEDAKGEGGGSFDPNALSEDLALFPLGVQSGEVHPGGGLLWTRFLGDGLLKVVVFADAYKDQPGEVYWEAVVDVESGGFVHEKVGNLQSYTNYRYCFYTDEGMRSAIGYFRTAPDDDELTPVVFGASSCINQLFQPYDTLEQAGADALDFFILGGDNVYADGSNTLEDYRDVWEEAVSDVGYQELFQNTSIMATWDDHEVTNNWDPESLDTEQIDAATAGFFEFLALSPFPEPESHRVWRSFRWGKTVEVFLLDCRSERRSSQNLYISVEQMDWLKEGLENSEAVFKVIMNSVPITEMPWYIPEKSDRWQGWADQRTEILDHIVNEVEGVVWLTGDFHFGGIMKVGVVDSPHHELYEIMVGPGAQLGNPAWIPLFNDPEVKGQFPFLTGFSNYTRFSLQPESDPPSITVEFVAGSGGIIHSDVLYP